MHKTQQTLTFYELDLGLNHVVRKYSEPLEEHANFLVTVPGGNDGPSGVLICSENYLTYKNLGDQHDIRCPIPRRRVSDLLVVNTLCIFMQNSMRVKGIFTKNRVCQILRPFPQNQNTAEQATLSSSGLPSR